VSAGELSEISRYLPGRLIRQRLQLASMATANRDLLVRLPGSWVPASGGRLLLWAEVDDGFWALRLNGEEAPFTRMPADLRGIDLSALRTAPGEMVDVAMVYRAPLSRIWRR
jgi:hypothetical protein